MHVLITGGTGFIGSRLALACVQAGEDVRVLAQTNTPAEEANARLLQEQGMEVALGSVTDTASLAAAMNGVQVVYHLAAAQHEANVPDAHFHDVNVTGTRNVMEAAITAGAQRVVHGSTIGVYRATPGETTTNSTPLEPDNIYGKTKLLGEAVVRSFGDRMPAAIIRISETYGPGDRRLHKLFAGIKRGRFPFIGRGENLHHLVYIDDLVTALRQGAVAETAIGRTVVVAGPAPISTRRMAEIVAREVGAPFPRLRIPMGPMLLAATVTEGLLRPLGIQPPLHRRRMDFFRKGFRFSLDDARAALGWEPAVDFDLGAARTAQWYAQQGEL